MCLVGVIQYLLNSCVPNIRATVSCALYLGAGAPIISEYHGYHTFVHFSMLGTKPYIR